jgi:outer membrane protein
MGIPIYSRRVNKTNINKFKIQLQQSQLALYNTRSILTQQVERTYINLLNAQAQYKAAEIQLKTSEEIYSITNEQLKLGAVNAMELLIQKNAYVQALQAYTQAKYTAALYNKIYEFYMGIPVSF